MNDGTSLEVPYYWEADGEIKFEMPGGVAGIPKNEVRSVQEIILAKEFDPETLVESPDKPGSQTADKKPDKTAEGSEQKKLLRELATTKAPRKPSTQEVSVDEGVKLMKGRSAAEGKPGVAKERAYGPGFNFEGDFSEFVRAEGNDVLLIMRNVLSSRKDLKNQSFALILYDADGNVLEQRPCELHPIDVDKKTLKKIGIRGFLYTVTTTVKPDPKIKRYEIAALQR